MRLIACSIAIAMCLSMIVVVAAQPATPSLTFPEQSSGGHAVRIAAAFLPEPGFVVIHDATLLDGEAVGSVIGVSPWLPQGNARDVWVPLSRPLEGANETLVAMLHQDTDGDRMLGFGVTQGAVDGPFTGGADVLAASPLAANTTALTAGGLANVTAVARNVVHSAFVHARTQENNGASVLVDLVDLSAPGYLVVHDESIVEGVNESGLNATSVMGSIVGASQLLPAGIHRNVVIGLHDNCGGCKEKGRMEGRLLIMAHEETGGNATSFDFVSSRGREDLPFQGPPNGPVQGALDLIQVRVVKEPRLILADQATGGHVVTFAEVFVPRGGYAVVHDASFLEGDVTGSIVGVSELLAPGLHRDVVVTLDHANASGLNESQTLVGMLYKETDGDGAFGFVESRGDEDEPYTGGPNSTRSRDLPSALQRKGLGGVTAVTARVNLSASVRMPMAQVAEGGVVRVQHADLAEEGVIVLHDASLLADPNAPGSIVGVSESFQGYREDLEIPIGGDDCDLCDKRALAHGQTLIAMPHTAAGPVTTDPTMSNSMGAFNTSVVVAMGEVAIPPGGGETPVAATPPTAAPTPATPATPTPTTPAPVTSEAPSPTPTATPPLPGFPEESAALPAPGILVVLAAALVALVVATARRRR